MAINTLPTRRPPLIERALDRLYRHLMGPTVRFEARQPGSNPGHVGAACTGPQVGDTEVGFLQAQDPGASPPAPEPPAASTSTPPASEVAAAAPTAVDPWPVGRGRHADNCLFLDDPRHECLNSYGFPIRSGQACWHSSRVETLRSFAEQHPAFARLVRP